MSTKDEKSFWCKIGWHDWLVLDSGSEGSIRNDIVFKLKASTTLAVCQFGNHVEDRICRCCKTTQLRLTEAKARIHQEVLNDEKLREELNYKKKVVPSPPPAPSSHKTPPAPDLDSHQPNITFYRNG